MAEKDSFLGRWARRKALAKSEGDRPRGARRGGAAPVLPEIPGTPPKDAVAALAPGDPEIADSPREKVGERPAEERSSPDRLDPSTLPDIESLDDSSDFTVFMREGVPEDLRNIALRRLWRMNPVYANLDELLEYGEDYTDAAAVVEGLKSIYQGGKGVIAPENEAAGPGEPGPDSQDGAPQRRESAESQASPSSESGESSDRASAEERDAAGSDGGDRSES